MVNLKVFKVTYFYTGDQYCTVLFAEKIEEVPSVLIGILENEGDYWITKVEEVENKKGKILTTDL